jgi:hypothetical protein
VRREGGGWLDEVGGGFHSELRWCGRGGGVRDVRGLLARCWRVPRDRYLMSLGWKGEEGPGRAYLYVFFESFRFDAYNLADSFSWH